ncbi:Hypothetical protein A7982_06700 [Minicystis rosea]|nr:Hypothetical protein A7982_06700 [Minicystis rosea]
MPCAHFARSRTKGASAERPRRFRAGRSLGAASSGCMAIRHAWNNQELFVRTTAAYDLFIRGTGV